jgi:hypothetical protein
MTLPYRYCFGVRVDSTVHFSHLLKSLIRPGFTNGISRDHCPAVKDVSSVGGVCFFCSYEEARRGPPAFDLRHYDHRCDYLRCERHLVSFCSNKTRLRASTNAGERGNHSICVQRSMVSFRTHGRIGSWGARTVNVKEKG